MDRKGKGQPITSWTIHMIFRDFLGKRAGLIKALTTGPSFPLHYEKFRQQCDPQKPYMCLYGCPDETWELKEPPDVPHELPEPNIGINFARDGMPEKEWLGRIAIHSDAWLYSYAFYIAIRADLDAETRMRLFDMINFNPTIYEIVRGTVNTKRAKEKPPGTSSKKTPLETLHTSLPFIPHPRAASLAVSFSTSAAAVAVVAVACCILTLPDNEPWRSAEGWWGPYYGGRHPKTFPGRPDPAAKSGSLQGTTVI
ncbi:unnamed protein product [Musa hybrid cultivar]